MQEQFLLLLCTFLGLLFTDFPVRGACLCTIAIAAFVLLNHILVACNYLGQQTITAILRIVHIVRLVPSVLASVSSALTTAAAWAKRINAPKHTWTGMVNILRRNAAGSLKAIGVVALYVIKVSKQSATCKQYNCDVSLVCSLTMFHVQLPKSHVDRDAHMICQSSEQATLGTFRAS